MIGPALPSYVFRQHDLLRRGFNVEVYVSRFHVLMSGNC